MFILERLVNSPEAIRVVSRKVEQFKVEIISGKISHKDKVEWRELIILILREFEIPDVYLDMVLGEDSIYMAYAFHKNIFTDLFLKGRPLAYMSSKYGNSISYYSHIRVGRRLKESSSGWAFYEGLSVDDMYRDRRGYEILKSC